MTPFTLQVSDLTNLGQDRAVEFFRRLLWAEAGKVGVGRHLIDVPDCINVGDGGIDAYIENANPSSDEIIPRGMTGYQIKSTDLSPKDCRKELCQDKKKSIKPEIKRVLDNGGTYVLVLFADITSQKKIRREMALKAELKRLGFPRAKIRVFTANQLIGFAERYLSLVTWFRNELSQCLPYSSWAQREDVKVPKQFVFDDERKQWVEDVRHSLRNPGDDCPVFRVIGLSGMGKTRLVFEALSPDDLKHRVIYVHAENFLRSSIYNTLQNNHELSAVIVIDECDLQQHDEFVRSFSGRGPRLAIFTLSFNMAKVAPPTKPFEVKPLAQDKLAELIENEAPQLPKDVVRRLSQFADGYPRIAVLLSESYLAGSGSSEGFITITDEALFNRLIGDRSDITSEHFKRTRLVLMWLSIFSKVGYRGAPSAESKWIASTIGIDWNIFTEIVSEQKRRGIVQGQFYIYVTPFMLKVELSREWWELRGSTQESFNEFVASIPEQFKLDLLKRFIDQIPYVTLTKEGREFVKSILAAEGLYADGVLLKTELGADFFLKLTEADPESALECLKMTIGTWSKEELLEFKTGRREVVGALERIAVWKDLFVDAVRLLLALGEAENEHWANNASGIFIDLFSPAPGSVAPTEASPEERFPILVEALDSDSKERRSLGLRACDHALESRHFSRIVGAEYQGLRREPKLWEPETYGEWFDAYRQVWRLLRERLQTLPKEERKQAVTILLNRARSLLSAENLSDMILDTLVELYEKSLVEKKTVLAEVVNILHYDGGKLPQKTRERLEQIRDRLAGSDFASLMQRFVAMDLFVDHFDEQGNQVDVAQPRITQLAQQALGDVDLLRPELSWLVTTEAQNGYRFGYELGTRDTGLLLLPTLLDAQLGSKQNPSLLFLGGYFHAIFERDPDIWERQLDVLSGNRETRPWVAELTWRSGMSDRAAMRILKLAESGVINTTHFGMFTLGGVLKHISEPVAEKWVQSLLESADSTGASIALSLVNAYYLYGEPKRTLPEELTLKLLTEGSRHILWGAIGIDTMTEHHWTEIGKAFAMTYPSRGLDLANDMLEHLGDEHSIFGVYNSPGQAVLNLVTRQNPVEVWNQVTRYVGPPIDSRAFHVTQWLRGGDAFQSESEGILSIIPMEELWNWVEEDVEHRAWYLASFVPRVLPRKSPKPILSREILVRYGSREDVRRNLMANLSSEGWSGSASSHFEAKKRVLVELRKQEDNRNVLRWIDEYVTALSRDIERERISEERGDD